MASNNKISKIDNSSESDLMGIIESIDDIQNQLDIINEKASDEILVVEQKYNVIRKPHLAKRTGLISQIPKFWKIAFANHPQLNSMLSDEDLQILEYLQNIDVQESEDIKSGYKIIFNFNSNPFFSNNSLIKTFNTSTEIGQVVLGTKINWTRPAKKEDKKGLKRATEEEESFFEWFEDDSEASNDEIAELIKEDLWSNPMGFYIGNDMDEEDFDDEEVDDEEEEDEEDDE